MGYLFIFFLLKLAGYILDGWLPKKLDERSIYPFCCDRLKLVVANDLEFNWFGWLLPALNAYPVVYVDVLGLEPKLKARLFPAKRLVRSLLLFFCSDTAGCTILGGETFFGYYAKKSTSLFTGWELTLRDLKSYCIFPSSSFLPITIVGWGYSWTN